MMMERRYGVEPLDPFSCVRIVTDYHWYRAHHRKMWSTIARLDDATILEFDFDIVGLKRAVVLELGLDASQIYNNAYCYACAWVTANGRGCEICPINHNLGGTCSSGNIYRQFTRLYIDYTLLECSARAFYLKQFTERFRMLALEMANAW